MLEGRTREHQSVEQGHRQAGGNAGRQRAHDAASRGAVDVDLVADAGLQHRDAVRLTGVNEGDVRDEAAVKDCAHGLGVVAAARRLTPYPGPPATMTISRHSVVLHSISL